MEQLKTDYKDAIYTGNRKYQITALGDNISAIEDRTEYTQEGDQFGSNDINKTNAAINRLAREITLIVQTNSWSSTAPYKQTISIAEMKETDNPWYLLDESSTLYTGANSNGRAELRAQFDYIDGFATEDGSIILTCRDYKPSKDIPIVIRSA